MLRFQFLLLGRVSPFASSLGAEDSECLETRIEKSWSWIGENGVGVRMVEREEKVGGTLKQRRHLES